MEKLRLDLDALKVDSFEASEEPGGAGTIRAYDEDATCSKQPTCGVASRGEATFEMLPPTRYACCV